MDLAHRSRVLLLLAAATVAACQGLFEERDARTGDADADGDGSSAADAADAEVGEVGSDDADPESDVDPDPESDSDPDVDEEMECITYRGGLCNPILQCGCPAGHYCQLGLIFEEVCTRGAGGALGDFAPCSSQRQCLPGYACLPTEEFLSNHCLRLCVDASVCAAGSDCVPIEAMGMTLEPYGYCEY